MDGDVLKCTHCSKTCGTQISSEISLASCGAGLITNRNGVLACDEPLPPNAANLPTGTFAGSCHGCSLSAEDTMLSCSACLDGAKVRHASSLVVGGCKAIGNNQGALVCEDSPMAQDAAAAANTEL